MESDVFEEQRIAKLREKIIKLKKQFEHPSFQRNAGPEAKEKLRRKVRKSNFYTI